MQDHIPNTKDHNNPILAFYAPMKSPYSPRPSGDRTIGALLVKALTAAGFDVEIASDFRSWEGRGDPRVQEEIRIRGEKAASDLVNGYMADCPRNRPVAWISYHLYHKSPDWIGSTVSSELDIPDFCAEASVSTRQMDGPWGTGFTASIEAIRLARNIFNLNPRDLPALAAAGGSRRA